MSDALPTPRVAHPSAPQALPFVRPWPAQREEELMRFKDVLVRTGMVVAATATTITVTAVPALAAAQDLNKVIGNLVAVIVSLVAGLATLFLTVGGVLYLTAAGNPEQVSRAKNALKLPANG